MIVEYQLNEDDFVDAQFAHLQKRWGRLRIVSSVVWSCLGIVGATAWLLWLSRQPREMKLVQIASVAVGVGMAIHFRQSARFRRQFRKIRMFQDLQRIVVDSKEVLFTNSRGEGRVLWTAFEDWRESPRCFLLYTQPNLFFIVPKRAIQADQTGVFRELLSSHI